MQARPITTLSEPDLFELDSEVPSPDYVYTTCNIGEILPGAITPLTWTVFGPALETGFRDLYAAAGAYPEEEAHICQINLFGGHLFCVVASLAEPLTLCLVLAAMLLYARDRVGWSACCFALAVLTRETTLLLVAGYVLSMLLRRSVRQGLFFGGVVALAFVIWQLCLFVWLGSFGVGAGGAGATPFHVIPFGALFSVLHVGWATFLLFAVILVPFVALPTVWAILATGQAILRGERHPWALALALFALVVPFLPASTFLDLSAMPRFASPLVALVVLYAARTKRHRVLRASLLWMTTATLVPFV